MEKIDTNTQKISNNKQGKSINSPNNTLSKNNTDKIFYLKEDATETLIQYSENRQKIIDQYQKKNFKSTNIIYGNNETENTTIQNALGQNAMNEKLGSLLYNMIQGATPVITNSSKDEKEKFEKKLADYFIKNSPEAHKKKLTEKKDFLVRNFKNYLSNKNNDTELIFQDLGFNKSDEISILKSFATQLSSEKESDNIIYEYCAKGIDIKNKSADEIKPSRKKNAFKTVDKVINRTSDTIGYIKLPFTILAVGIALLSTAGLLIGGTILVIPAPIVIGCAVVATVSASALLIPNILKVFAKKNKSNPTTAIFCKANKAETQKCTKKKEYDDIISKAAIDTQKTENEKKIKNLKNIKNLESNINQSISEIIEKKSNIKNEEKRKWLEKQIDSIQKELNEIENTKKENLQNEETKKKLEKLKEKLEKLDTIRHLSSSIEITSLLASQDKSESIKNELTSKNQELVGKINEYNEIASSTSTSINENKNSQDDLLTEKKEDTKASSNLLSSENYEYNKKMIQAINHVEKRAINNKSIQDNEDIIKQASQSYEEENKMLP